MHPGEEPNKPAKVRERKVGGVRKAWRVERGKVIGSVGTGGHRVTSKVYTVL
jgi:hypothetical protein